jgi:siroheme synthase-like protein
MNVMTRYYPLALNLTGRRCVVIGAGAVAERKVRGLLAADALTVVIGPRATLNLRQLANEGRITLHEREMTPTDLDGAALVIAAMDAADVNARVVEEARRRGAWANAVDDPTHSDVLAPAVLRRGDLTLAISTGGASPALAAALRRQLESQFGDEYAALVELLGALRDRVKAVIPDRGRRERFWQRLITRDLNALLELLRRGEHAEARRRAEENLAEWK